MNLADQIIKAFGGIRPAQRALGEKYPNLIKSWVDSGRIPHYREDQIRKAAAERQIQLPEDVMAKVFPKPDASSSQAAA